MLAVEIMGTVLVLAAIGAMSQRKYRTGFILNLLSAFTWTVVAVDADLWGLLALQGGITALAIRGLWTHRKEVHDRNA